MNGRTPRNPSEANSTANRLAVERIVAAKPVLVGCERASDALGLGEGELGHAGRLVLRFGFHDDNVATGWIGIEAASTPVACFESAIEALDTP